MIFISLIVNLIAAFVVGRTGRLDGRRRSDVWYQLTP